MKCPICEKRKAVKSNEYGILPCQVCQNDTGKPKKGVEFTTQSIKDQRREYKRDILQPFRDGVLSKEYLETYGESGITVTPEERKNAKYVWKDTKGWWNRDKSKGGR